MKKHILISILFLFLAPSLYSQAPQSIPYQAVVRNTDGSVMADAVITMTFKIHDNSATGIVVYEENHTATTNAQGLISLNVGSGSVVSGTFSGINWGAGSKFLHVLMNAGSGVVDLGTQQMMSVPYALYAEDVNVRVSATGDSLFIGDQVSIVPGVSAANSHDLSAMGSILLGDVVECSQELISVNGCGGEDSILFDGYYYDLVEVAGQCWFKENLRSIHYNDGFDIGQVGISSEAQVYIPDLNLYPQALSYGNYYSAASAMSDRLCPNGWHIPTHCDWAFLESKFGPPMILNQSYVNNGIALIDGLEWGISNNAVNSSGLSIISSGVYNQYSNSINFDSSNNSENQGHYWTSSKVNLTGAGDVGFDTSSGYWPLHREFLNWNSPADILISNGLAEGPISMVWNSVRCVKSPNDIVVVDTIIIGCNNPLSCNFISNAVVNPGWEACIAVGDICNDYNALTINDTMDAECNCIGESIVNGCTNFQACNFNLAANVDDGSCLIQGTNCNDGNLSTANDLVGLDCVCQGTPLINGLYVNGNGVTDNSGNFYPSIIINGQEWMKENLKTTKYRNGAQIPTGLSNSAWQTTTTGAYNTYNNSYYDLAYGNLYNWYAVNDSRGICPTGWHVPSDSDWTQLINFIDSQQNPNSSGTQSYTAGGKLKTFSFWTLPNVGATNSTSFSGLPAGLRGTDGSYNQIGYLSIWWSSSAQNSNSAWDRRIWNNSTNIDRLPDNKNLGFSVRCLRD